MKNLVLTSESDARAAALVTSYGVGTRSYNRSGEKREMDRQRAEVTRVYMANPPKPRFAPLLCRCMSWEFPHEIEQHRQLNSDYDWPTPKERKSRNREFWEHAI